MQIPRTPAAEMMCLTIVVNRKCRKEAENGTAFVKLALNIGDGCSKKASLIDFISQILICVLNSAAGCFAFTRKPTEALRKKTDTPLLFRPV